jgi:hypothetical protein
MSEETVQTEMKEALCTPQEGDSKNLRYSDLCMVRRAITDFYAEKKIVQTVQYSIP